MALRRPIDCMETSAPREVPVAPPSPRRRRLIILATGLGAGLAGLPAVLPGMPSGLRTGIYATLLSVVALAAALAGIIGSQVLDETGLKGAYDFKLQFVDRAETAPGSAVAGIFPAIQQQLGLKLDARKVPMKMLVIDGVEKPGGN